MPDQEFVCPVCKCKITESDVCNSGAVIFSEGGVNVCSWKEAEEKEEEENWLS